MFERRAVRKMRRYEYDSFAVYSRFRFSYNADVRRYHVEFFEAHNFFRFRLSRCFSAIVSSGKNKNVKI